MLPSLSARDKFSIPHTIRKERFMKKKWLIILWLAFVVIPLLPSLPRSALSDNSYSYFVTAWRQTVITGFDKTYWGNLSIPANSTASPSPSSTATPSAVAPA